MNPLAPLVEQQPEQERTSETPRVSWRKEFRRQELQALKTAEYRHRAKATAEKLRYRAYVRNGTPMDVMRRTRAFAIRYWWIAPLGWALWRV